MTNKPKDAPSLGDLRKDIDRIDEAMHGLLMERGEIINRLISVKKTQESGSAFRPAREADMMRRLVQRHKGILPLDTAESILRVIIATFTHVQAPFSVHADLSAGDAMMRDSARFHFGFTVPFVPHFGAAGVRQAGSGSQGHLRRRPARAAATGPAIRCGKSRRSGLTAMPATRPQPRQGVLEIDAYVPGKSSAPGVAKIFKLSSNETPLGPSPKAIAAYNAVGKHLE